MIQIFWVKNLIHLCRHYYTICGPWAIPCVLLVKRGPDKEAPSSDNSPALQCSAVQYSAVHLQQGWLGVTRSPQSMHCLSLLQVLRSKLFWGSDEPESPSESLSHALSRPNDGVWAPHSSCDLVCIWLWSRIRDQTSPRSSEADGVRPPLMVTGIWCRGAGHPGGGASLRLCPLEPTSESSLSLTLGTQMSLLESRKYTGGKEAVDTCT